MYETQVLDEIEIPIGGKWFYKVWLIRDSMGVRKVRVVKGKTRDDGTIAQVQKINFKTFAEADKVFRAVREMFDRHGMD